MIIYLFSVLPPTVHSQFITVLTSNHMYPCLCLHFSTTITDLSSNFLCESQWPCRLAIRKSSFLCHASLGVWKPIHSNYPLWTDGPKLQSKDQSLVIPRETVSWTTFSGSSWPLEKPWLCCVSPLTAGRLRYQPHAALGLSRKERVRNLEELLGGWLFLTKRTWLTTNHASVPSL